MSKSNRGSQKLQDLGLRTGLALTLIMVLTLTACSGQQLVNNSNQVKVIPKPKAQRLTVVGIDDLHHGVAWDVAPDGKTVLWNEDKKDLNPGDESGPPVSLFTMNLENGAVKLLKKNGGNIGYAEYSPNGAKISYLAGSEETDTPYTMENKANSPSRAVAKNPTLAWVSLSRPLAWTPDSAYFAVAYRYLSRGEVVIYDAAKGDQKKVIQTGAVQQRYFYDDDTLIYVASSEKDTIMAQNIQDLNSPAQKIVDGYVHDFVVSPNKQRLAYVTGLNRLALKIDAFGPDLQDGANLVQISAVGSYIDMVWSPDSRYLLCFDDRSLWAVNPETTEKTQLVSNVHVVSPLLWPERNTIIFSGYIEGSGDGSSTHIYRVNLN